ncbi:DNA polymerase I [candidate division TA06 bacterium]|nr:DNA polymerase I [candidate division TA06 bacterium]
MKKRLFLIDGSALAYRSYFAFIRNPLRNSKGENTGAVFGYISSLLKLVREENPPYIAVCFDTPAPTFRHKKFADYKATREKMPVEMQDQMPIIKEITGALGISIIELDGFEADDVMGTLAQKAKTKGMAIILVSGDKDFLQLVNDGVKVYNPGRGGKGEGFYGREEVLEKYGVPPERVPDLFGLTGDSIDNVPGVPGIGMKTATRLLNEFGSLEEVVKNAEKISRKNLKETLITFTDQALLSKDLVTIRTDAPVELDLVALAYSGSDENHLKEIYKRMEFYSLLKELGRSDRPIAPTAQIEVHRIEKKEELKSLCENLLAQKGFAIALRGDELSFTWKAGEAYIVAISKSKIPIETVLEKLQPAIEDEKIWKVSDDFKSLLHLLDPYPLRITGHESPIHGPFFDTSIASYLLNPMRRDHSLAGLVLQYLPETALGESTGEKSSALIELKGVMEKDLERDGLEELFRDVEMNLVPVLFRMERNGVLIDRPFFQEMSENLSREIRGVEEKIYRLAGEEFNIRSPKQLRTILFEKLKLPKSKRTKTGYSTAVEVLEELSLQHKLPEKILEYRELFKLKSTYVDVLPKLIRPESGRVHTTFDQTVAATGRLSSRDPNMQNVPMRTELGREIRKGFTAPPGERLLSADYSQVELRILAHLSGDETLREAFRKGEDIHSRTASLIFQVPLREMKPEVRNRAKAINFGIVYGLSPFGLSQQLGIPLEDASAFIAAYFATYPKVKEWIDQEVDLARERGFTTTLLNRRRYIPEIRSRNRDEREFGERVAMNSPIQGTAADMIKIAMIRIDQEIEKRGLHAKMILQIHDELVFEVPEGEVEEISLLAKEKMANALPLEVPVVVEVGVGKNWFEAH